MKNNYISFLYCIAKLGLPCGVGFLSSLIILLVLFCAISES